MLHGYTQSGPLFRAKSRAVEKHLQKAFPGTTLTYPTGPLQLRASDVPGLDPSTTTSDAEDIEAYGWWRRSNTADPPEYIGIDDGLSEVSKTLAQQGPFDGVVGFSQGAALAAMVSSLLEAGPERREAFRRFHANESSSSSSLSIPFPPSFNQLQHPPMKFCILYSGFVAPGERYRAFYYSPRISTPSFHFIGSLDSVVEEGRSRTLFDAFGGGGAGEQQRREEEEEEEEVEEEEVGSKKKTKTKLPELIYHPGGHFVPSSRQFLDVLVKFIREAVGVDRVGPRDVTAANGEMNGENGVEEMDVPF
jgi:fermentation-respiration switch protein FrsA (DUF1100 family)